jgi:hypothetical protein
MQGARPLYVFPELPDPLKHSSFYPEPLAGRIETKYTQEKVKATKSSGKVSIEEGASSDEEDEEEEGEEDAAPATGAG